MQATQLENWKMEAKKRKRTPQVQIEVAANACDFFSSLWKSEHFEMRPEFKV